MIWTIIFVVILVASVILHKIGDNSGIDWLCIVSFILGGFISDKYNRGALQNIDESLRS